MAFDAAGHLVDLDVPLFRTIGHLVTRPGRMCRDYIAGRRRTYTTPLRFVLFILTLVVLSFAVFGGPGRDAVDSMNVPVSTPGSPIPPMALVDLLEQWFHVFTMATMPIVAMVMWLLYGKRFTYAEHFAIACFIIGMTYAISIVLAIFGIGGSIYAIVASAVIEVAYMSWAFTGCYGGNVLMNIGKSFVVVFTKFLTGSILGACIGVGAVLLVVLLRIWLMSAAM